MQIPANSIEEYLGNIPEERKVVFKKLYLHIQKNMPKDFQETMIYGMIGWVVPHSMYPKGYHCDPKLPLSFLNLASQKNFIALYHMGIYADKALCDWFVSEYPKHAKYKLDMGKSCIRFKKLDDIPFDLIAELVKKMTAKDWITLYEKAFMKKD